MDTSLPAKVTMEMIEANIVREDYFTAEQGISGGVNATGFEKKQQMYGALPESAKLMTFCILTLRNGYTVTGQAACVNPAIFKKETGEKYAREDAVDKIWPLMGYELKSQYALLNSVGAPSTGPFPSAPGSNHFISLDFATYLGTKVIHAAPMTRGEYNTFRGWMLPENEDAQEEGYLVQYTDGGAPNMDCFPGYVSWSPKEVFEKAYKTSGVVKKTTFVDRLVAEFADLNERTNKLTVFLGSEGFKHLASIDRMDLERQHGLMLLLRNVLEQRLSRLQS